MLHGRACPGGRHGCARVPPQADGQASEAPRRAQRRGREDRLGQARRRRASTAASPSTMAFGSYVAAAAEVSVERQQDQDPPHRRRDRSGLRGQSGADRAAGRRLVRVRPDRRCSSAACTVKDGAIEQENFDTYDIDADRGDAEGGSRSSCRPAASGAASASRPSAWRRRRCSTPSSAATGKRYPLVPAARTTACRWRRSTTGSGGLTRPPLRSSAFGLRDGIDMTEARAQSAPVPANHVAAAAATAAFPLRRCIAQGAGPRVVVVGGGFGGASLRPRAAQGRPAPRGDAGRGQRDLHRAAR